MLSIESLPGFVVRKLGGTTLYVKEGFEDAITKALGSLANTEQGKSVTGRASHPIVPLPGSEKQIVIRHCWHGGLLAPLTRDRFLSIKRFKNEIKVTQLALEKGIATTEVLALRVVRRFCFYTADIVTRYIPDAPDLLHWLNHLPDATKKRKMLKAVASTLRRLHDAGMYHADIQLKNILYRQESGEVYIIDFDRARVVASVTVPLRLANLFRLARSVQKRDKDGNITESDNVRFLKCYIEAGEHLNIDIEKSVAACKRQIRRHSLLWKRD